LGLAVQQFFLGRTWMSTRCH